jgi:hypothetical protein
MPGHIGAWAHPADHRLGQADGPHEQRHGVAATACVKQLGELRDVGLLPAGSVRVGHERWLPQRQPGDGQAGRGRVQGEDRAGGVPEDRRRPAGRGDHGVEVLDLSLDRVRRAVAAVAAPPAVVVEHLEVGRQQLGQLRVDPSGGRRTADQDDRRARTQPVEGDGGAVAGTNLVHETSLPS